MNWLKLRIIFPAIVVLLFLGSGMANASEKAIPRDIAFCILRMLEDVTLADSARYRSVCHSFRDAAPQAFAGRLAVTVRNSSDLERLLGLEHSPFLENIGTLTFDFRDGEIKSADLPSFLDRNTGRLGNIHTVKILNAGDDEDVVTVRPFLARVVGRNQFRGLRHLQVESNAAGRHRDVRYDWHFESGIAFKTLESLVLRGVIVSNPEQIDALLSWIGRGFLKHLRRLILLNARFNARQIEDLRVLIESGHLPQLEEFHFKLAGPAAESSTQFIQTLSDSGIRLRRLALDAGDEIEEVLHIAHKGGFRHLVELDARAINSGFRRDMQRYDWRKLFPALSHVIISCNPSAIYWLRFNFLLERNNIDLVRVCDSDALCAQFADDERTCLSSDIGSDNPLLDTIGYIADIPVDARMNPEITNLIERARGLVRFPTNHAYRDLDVHLLLWLSLGHQVNISAPRQPLVLGNTVLFPPLVLTGYQTAGSEIAALLRSYFEGALKGEETRIVVPVKLKHHWMTIIIDVLRRNNGQNDVSAYLLDTRTPVNPLQNMQDEIKKAIVETFLHVPLSLTIEQLVPRARNYPDCGPVTVENILDAVRTVGRPVGGEVSEKDIRDLRRVHFQLLRDNHGCCALLSGEPWRLNSLAFYE